MPRSLIPSACAALLTACAANGHFSVTGTITDAEHLPLPQAQVELSLPDTTIRGQADTLGRFQLSGPNQHGCFRLVASFIGYGPALANVPLSPGRAINVGKLQLPTGGIPEIGALFWKFCRMKPDTVSFYAGVQTVVDSSH